MNAPDLQQFCARSDAQSADVANCNVEGRIGKTKGVSDHCIHDMTRRDVTIYIHK